MNGLDLFSGIGGIGLALKPWVRTVAYCEQDLYAQGVLLSRMRSGDLDRAPIWDDVRTLTAALLPEIDIIFGGFPCQDISVANFDGDGLDGERSKLFFEVVRLVGELRPQFVFLENVPAITLRGLDRVLLEFTALGYDCRWTIVSAAEMGACHLRERWWLCAHSNSARLQVSGRLEDEASKPRGQAWNPVIPVVQSHVWSEPLSLFRRGDDGLPGKTHRLRCLGNSVVPQAAREAFQRLSGMKGNT